MAGEPTQSRRCPYCGCGFEPIEPGQLYCSPYCEHEDRKKREAGSGARGVESEQRR